MVNCIKFISLMIKKFVAYDIGEKQRDLSEVTNVQMNEIEKKLNFLCGISSKSEKIQLHRKKTWFFIGVQLPFCLGNCRSRRFSRSSSLKRSRYFSELLLPLLTYFEFLPNTEESEPNYRTAYTRNGLLTVSYNYSL